MSDETNNEIFRILIEGTEVSEYIKLGGDVGLATEFVNMLRQTYCSLGGDDLLVKEENGVLKITGLTAELWYGPGKMLFNVIEDIAIQNQSRVDERYF